MEPPKLGSNLEKALQYFEEKMKIYGYQLEKREYNDENQKLILTYQLSKRLYKKRLKQGFRCPQSAMLTVNDPNLNFITLIFFVQSPMTRQPVKDYEIENIYRVVKNEIRPELIKKTEGFDEDPYTEHENETTIDVKKKPDANKRVIRIK